MKILVIGGGPSGLYFSYLIKRAHPGIEIKVVEQNPNNATFGFGVVFSDKALEFLPKVDNFFPMLGKITDETLDLDSQDDSFFSTYSKDEMKGWLEKDVQNLKNVPLLNPHPARSP